MKSTLEKIQTSRFGELEVATDDIMSMPEGIIGFADVKQYTMLGFHTEIDTALKWFQAVDSPDLAFVIIDPYTFRPDYQVNVTDEEMKILQTDAMDKIRIMTIVSIPKDPQMMTANLLGPILINNTGKIAVQLVLSDSGYTTSHYILPQE